MQQFCDQLPKTIVVSSASLGWEGVSIERGNANETILDKEASPFHHFCMITGKRITWKSSDDSDRMQTLTTYPGQIGIYPANTPLSRHIPMPYDFISLALAPEKVVQGLHAVPLKKPLTFRFSHNVEDPQLSG